MFRRARCAACGLSLPPDASRCPSCGHVAGDALYFEVGVAGGTRSRPGRPRSRRRDTAILISVAAIVLAVLAATSLSSGQSESTASEDATTTTERETTTTRRRPPRTTTTSTLPPGPVLGEPVGLILATIGPGDVVLTDLDTGAEIAEIEGLQSMLGLPGGLVAVAHGRASYTAVPLSGAPVDLGPADWALASDRPDRVWLASESPPGGARVREVDLAGATTVPEFEMNGWPVGAVVGGLLVEHFGGWFLLERDGDSRLLLYGQLIGHTRDRIVYSRCEQLDECSVRVLDIASGDERVLDTPMSEGLSSVCCGPMWGSASSDGSRLAVTVVASPEGTSSSIAVLDLDTGALSDVPGPWEPAGVTATWAPDGDRLFIVSHSNSPWLWTWRVGDAVAREVRLPGPSRGQPWGIAVFRTAPVAS